MEKDITIRISELMDLFDEGEVTTADQIERPEDPFRDFNERNPKAGGGMLVQPSADGSRPGYAGKPVSTKHLGGGVYEVTYKGGSKNYYGKYVRDGKTFKESFGANKKAAANFVKEGQKKPKAKNLINIQSEGGTLLEQSKYKTNLTKAINEVTALQEKGYGNIDEIVKKYQNKFTLKIGTKTRQGKIIKKGTGSTEYQAITFAINEHAKKLGIQSIKNNNVIKALDAYSKIKNPKRGDISKILKKYNVPESSFNRYLQEDKLNLRKKVPLQFGSEAEKRRYYAKLRNDAINEFSSQKFERFLTAPETALVQKSHMGDLYNQYVTTGNLGYAPNLINQESLKEVDAILKNYGEKIDQLLKDKPSGYIKEVNRLNQQGTDLAAATQGYKKFTARDPFTGKKFTISFSKPSQELDPTDLIVDEKGNPKKLSDLTAADKPTLQFLKEDAIERAKLSKKETKVMDKKIRSEVNKVLSDFFCDRKVAAEGGRLGFANGTCSLAEKKKNLVNYSKRVVAGDVAPETAERIAKEVAKVTTKAGSKGALATFLGPAGIGLDIVYEVGSIGFDVASGTPFKRALENNWITGAFTKTTAEEAYNKDLFAKFPEAKPYGRAGEIINRMTKIENALDKMESGTLGIEEMNNPERYAALQNEYKNLEKELDIVGRKEIVSEGPAGQFSYETYKALEPGSNEQIAYNVAKQEFDAIEAAKAPLKSLSEFGFQEMVKEGAQKRPVPGKIDIEMVPGVTEFTKPELKDILKYTGDTLGFGYTPYGLGYGTITAGPQTGQYDETLGYQQVADRIMEDVDKAKQGYFADNFRFEKAGGGIAGLSGGIDKGPQTTSMNPDSQGLSGLLKRGIKR